MVADNVTDSPTLTVAVVGLTATADTAIEPSSGQTKTLYDLPKDDFVSERVNYRKCIGLIGLQVKQTAYTVTHPTKYGRNDYGKYFTNNFVNATTKTAHMPVEVHGLIRLYGQLYQMNGLHLKVNLELNLL